jgi:hypothetical protein
MRLTFLDSINQTTCFCTLVVKKLIELSRKGQVSILKRLLGRWE